jgi:hypothetical protein
LRSAKAELLLSKLCFDTPVNYSCDAWTMPIGPIIHPITESEKIRD